MKRSVASGRGPNITNTVRVCSLIDPLSFTLKRSDKIIRREMRMTSRSLGRNSVRRESKALKSCLRLVLLDYDLWRDTFKTASKVKCEARTREWEKRKSSRVQDVSKTRGTCSSASTITLWNSVPEEQLFALLPWRGTPSCVLVIRTLLHCYSTCTTAKEAAIKQGCGRFVKIILVFQDFTFTSPRICLQHRCMYSHIDYVAYSAACQNS